LTAAKNAPENGSSEHAKVIGHVFWNRNGGEQKQRANNRHDGYNSDNEDERVELESSVIGEFAVPESCSGADRESREKQHNVGRIVLENRTDHGVERIPHCYARRRKHHSSVEKVRRSFEKADKEEAGCHEEAEYEAEISAADFQVENTKEK